MGEKLSLAVLSERLNNYIKNNDEILKIGRETRDLQISSLRELIDQRFEAQESYNKDCEERHSKNGSKNGKLIPTMLILSGSAGTSGLVTALTQLLS